MRLDFINASADKANVKPMAGPKTANQVYKMYYGNQETEQDETNVGGLLRYEQNLQRGFKIGLGLSLRGLENYNYVIYEVERLPPLYYSMKTKLTQLD